MAPVPLAIAHFLPYLFVETVSQSSGWAPTCYVAENVLELGILLPLIPSACTRLSHLPQEVLGAGSRHLAS